MQAVAFLTTYDNLTRGASPGLVFLVQRKSEGRGKGASSVVVGDAARGREGGGTGFNSRLA